MGKSNYTFRDTKGAGKRGPTIKWTDEMDAQLKHLYVVEKYTFQELANAMHLTLSCLQIRVRKIGIYQPKGNVLGEKYIQSKIRKILNPPVKKEQQGGNKNYRGPNTKWTDERDAQLRHLYTDIGLSVAKVAKAMGLSIDPVGRRVDQLGILRPRKESLLKHKIKYQKKLARQKGIPYNDYDSSRLRATL